MNKEIISAFPTTCRGADTRNQLLNPVNITIDIDSAGERRVGCPYLQPIKTRSTEIDEPERIFYFCGADHTVNDFNKSMIHIVTENEKNLLEIPEFDRRWNAAILDAAIDHPECFHKKPL